MPGINRSLIDRFVRISIDSCCCCWTTETPLTTFFLRVSIAPIPLDLLGVHRQIHPPITGYNKYRYSIHQLVDRPTGEFNRLLYRALYLLVKAIDIDRQFDIPIGQTIGIDRQFHVPIGHSVTGIDRQCDILIVTIANCADLSEPIGRRNRYR